MKRALALITIAACLAAVSCVDTQKFTTDITDLQRRVTALEERCNQMNSNIASVRSLVEASQGGDYITSVTPVSSGGKTTAYTITFAKGDPITIYHGKDGKDGKDGRDGANGKDGQDGSTPQIGVSQDTDGVLYWTLDGQWLLDATGAKVRAAGQDGKDGIDGQAGADGKDGQNGVTPLLKIENDWWHLSMDDGVTWDRIGKAKGEDGKDGQNGLGGDSMFTGIDYSSSDYVTFTLSNGTHLKVPTWSAFENLERQCRQMNTNLSSMKDILDAIDQSLFISSYSTIMENGKEIGFDITFNNGNKITIYHGKDGKDGADGQPGSNGTDGHTPQIGVKQDTDNVWYWTVDGQWLLANGGKVRASGRDGQNGQDGQDGQDGQNGADGITPQLRITKGNWEVSTDGGVTWTDMGKATGQDGQDGDSFFKAVTYDEDDVTFTLADNTVLTLPRSAKLQIAFDPAGKIELINGVKKEIAYSVTSSRKPVSVTVYTSSDIRAKVTPSDADGLAGTITLEATADIDEYSRVVVIADNGSRMISIPFALRITNGHAYVDLGLPSGRLWATCNVGAAKPEDYGDYFAWGDPEPYYSSLNPLTLKPGKEDGYSWLSYKYANRTYNKLTKYCGDASYGNNRFTDALTTLEKTDDAARVNWGGTWRMPTNEDFEELLKNCTSVWTIQGGVKGRKFTGPNGNIIFLPAAGFGSGTGIRETGTYGYYWSSSLSTDPSAAWNLGFIINKAESNGSSRFNGQSVRPVIE